MTDTIDVAALVERLTNLVGTQIEEDLEYIQAADAAMTDAVNALVLQADALAEARRENEKMGRLMLPEATAAAVRGHQLCMEAFNEVNRRMLIAEASLATMREALRGNWHGVFLDGRNEHGSHVLMLPERSIELEQGSNGDFGEVDNAPVSMKPARVRYRNLYRFPPI